jgi:hypothetical protein
MLPRRHRHDHESLSQARENTACLAGITANNFGLYYSFPL